MSLVKILNDKKVRILWAGFVILVSLGALAIDMSGIVPGCVYCRTQRVMLLVVGFSLVLDKRLIYLFVSIPAILMGLNVAHDHLFLHVKMGVFPTSYFSILAMLALYAFVISLYISIVRVYYLYKS